MPKSNRIEKERIKLNSLVAEASSYNIDLSNKALLKQSKKLDKLIADYMLSQSTKEEKTA